MIYYNERCRTVDQEAIDTLNMELESREEVAGDRDMMAAATFLWHCQKYKQAGQLVQKILDATGGSQNAVCLKGWIFLSSPKDEVQ